MWQMRFWPFSLRNRPKAGTWEAAWSTTHCCWYYANRDTGACSWTRPAGCDVELPRSPRPPDDTDFSLVPREDTLPDGWQSDYDPVSRAVYFYRRSTKERRWDKPPILPEGWQSGYDLVSQRVYYYNTETRERRWDLPPFLPPGWHSALDATSKRVYYYNAETKEKRWAWPDRPLPPGWGSAYDAVHQQVYYYNRETNESVWEIPRYAFPEPARITRTIGEFFVLFHAAYQSTACQIFADRKFVTFEDGILGPGIYFSKQRSNARQFAQVRPGKGPIIILRCEVRLGNILKVAEGKHTRRELKSHSCQSFKLRGEDLFMLPSNDTKQINVYSLGVDALPSSFICCGALKVV